MEKEIRKHLIKDCTTIIVILALLWLVLVYVMLQVSGIAPSRTVSTGILITGALAGTFSTASSVAVFIHLRNNRIELYTQELEHKFNH